MERNLTWHNMDIDRTQREQQMGQQACTIWMSRKVNGRKCIGKTVVYDGKEDHAFGWRQYTDGSE